MEIGNTTSGFQQPLEQASATALDRLRDTWANPTTQDLKKLKKAAKDFEAVFVNQLLAAMDKTVDRQGSLFGGGHAEEMFRGMMNQEIAQSIAHHPGGSGFGLAEAIYRQAAQALPKVSTPVEGEVRR